MADVYGGIEAGGSKFVCVAGTDPEHIRAEAVIPTTEPDETISRVVEFFQNYQETSGDTLFAIGIGSFGPLDLDPESSTYGSITSTPKPGWINADFAGTIEAALSLPLGFDTDVNAAAFGEYIWGNAVGLDDFVYITVGTGIGGGGMANGRLMHGLLHPEMGHMRVPFDPVKDPFPGVCPFHANCLEGLASGPALAERWGMQPELLPEDHPGWKLEAAYLAAGIHNLIMTLSPERIIIGGGVMRQPKLLPMIHRHVRELLGGYIQMPDVHKHIDRYIVAPALGERAGVLGALALGQRAAGLL